MLIRCFDACNLKQKMADPRRPNLSDDAASPHSDDRSQAQAGDHGDDGDHDDRPLAQPPLAPGPNFQWWIPQNGIRRDVIQADIRLYLGQDALVKSGEGIGEDSVCFLLHSSAEFADV